MTTRHTFSLSKPKAHSGTELSSLPVSFSSYSNHMSKARALEVQEVTL